MSFFDDASLAFLPSGGAGKDGKAYSIKPTDGTGDFTFSRGSNLTATRVGPTGLIEKGRQNLLKQSNQFDTSWILSNGASVGSRVADPNGGNNAWELNYDGTTGGRIQQQVSVTDGGVYVFSIYARVPSGTRDLQLYTTISGSPITITLTTTWQRFELFRTNVGYTQAFPQLRDNTGVAGTIHIYQAQYEAGLAATDYIESGASTGKAGLLENEPRFDYSGGATCPSLLLEPSRTNLVGQSEYFGGSYWTVDGASFVGGLSSPEGLSNAYELKEGANNGFHFFYDNGFTIVNGTSYTMSVFVKYNGRQWFRLWGQFGSSNKQAYFDVQNGVTGSKDAGVVSGIEDYGNGWYRVYLTATSDGTAGRYRGYLAITDGDPSYQGDDTSGVYLYGAAFEEGSYPTSYIPNHSGGSATRTDDLGSIGDYIGSTITFGPTDDFSIFYDGEVYQTDRMIIGGGDSGLNAGRLWIRGNEIRLDGTTPSVSKMAGTSVVVDLNTRFKLLVKRNGATIDFFLDGNKLTTTQGDTDATFVINSLLWSFNNVYTAFGRHNQLLVFSTALSDADCIALTT